MGKGLKEKLIIVGLLVWIPLIWIGLTYIGSLKGLQNLAMDWRFQVRGEIESPIPIYYVNMDPAFIAEFGQSPWHRSLFADTAASILELGKAKSIFFDFVISPVTSTKMVPDDVQLQSNEVLANAVRKYSSKLILAVSYSGLMMNHMMRPSELPLKYRNSYDPETNAYPESPTYPIWDISYGRTGLINTDTSLSGGAIPRWVPVFSEVKNSTHSLNHVVGFLKHHQIPGEKLKETEKTYDIYDNENEIIRSYPKILPITFYTSSLELLLAYHGLPSAVAVKHFDDHLEIRNFMDDDKLIYDIPLYEGQMIEINWFSSWSSKHNPMTSMRTVLEKFYSWRETKDPLVEKEALDWFKRFEGAIVLVGPTDPLLQDVAPSPFDRHEVPRVAVHGNLIKTISTGKYITHLPQWVDILLIVVLTSLVAFFGLNSGARSVLSKIFSVLFVMVYTGFVFYLFKQNHLVIPLIGPVGSAITTTFIGVIYKLLVEEKQKGRIKGMFGTYVSPELVNRMVESGEEPKLGGHEEVITAFFSDVQSFSAFSEILTPSQLVDLMNEYLNEMTEFLEIECGSLDKYIGDAIVAMFGAPVKLEDHAYRACVASQRIQNKQAELREKWRSEGDKWPNLVFQMRTRIGLNSGLATVGNMGSRKRFNYTMMGDTVNLAARCESGAKAYGAYTMITEECKVLAEKSGDDIVYRYLDKIVVKGRTQPVSVYEIMGMKKDVSKEGFDCLDIYNQAVEKYLKQEWDAAVDLFKKSSEFEPTKPDVDPGVPTNPSLHLIKQSLAMKANPPGDDWDGRYVMTSK